MALHSSFPVIAHAPGAQPIVTAVTTATDTSFITIPPLVYLTGSARSIGKRQRR
jgi:hypothetical protein